METFHPTIRDWFAERLGTPSPPQEKGWPRIQAGEHVLIAAPTGSGKTLAAFLSALDQLLKEGDALEDATRVLYVSPLKALGNDVAKNLLAPLAELRERDPSLPEVRVAVRSGDTPQSERTRMLKEPPHVLVTTPESLYILLTSDGGRGILKDVGTVIVDEIHAVLGDKRGSHLALSLERLAALCPGEDGEGPQRIGLSATQKPLADVARFLGGVGREVVQIDEGHLRELDLAVEIPPSPLETVCSHETWSEIYGRVATLIQEHRTTLVFVLTRKLAERASAQLANLLGEEAVTCHHSSLSKERRFHAEERLKAGKLRALVATASLELGIDVGDVDLVVQLGTPTSIATLLQRVGRAGHGVGRTPKGRLFPLTRDELVDSAALLGAIRRGELDRTPQPTAPRDILAQQIVASCVPEDWDEAELFGRMRTAWPYRELERAEFDTVVGLHLGGRHALLHRDGVGERLRATRRARLTAITSGGAIPDTTQYRVVQEPDEVVVGQVDEDFAVESSAGDVFQLGNTSWRVLRVTRGVMRVADAHGVPPSLPFWVAEAPSRTFELSQAIGVVRERGVEEGWLEGEGDLPHEAVGELRRFLQEGRDALGGAVPTQRRLVLERFFDESGGMQLVMHSPFGGRINRAFGLALRKRFCRSFGFELQAAANEDAIVLSLGPQHSFPLEEVFDYLRPEHVRDMLVQAVLVTPMFAARWRWNVTRSLLVERFSGGKKVPAPLLRMRADDKLAEAFPDAVACGENLPPGDLPIPWDHPLVAQTLEDCLEGAMDVDGLIALLGDLRDGTIERVAIDTSEPSPFAHSILNARPYAFLDDAPLEERRTQAVLKRRALGSREADEIGALDPLAVARVREEAWPDPREAEEVHEALGWMGYATEAEAKPWAEWLAELADADRVVLEDGRWWAVESTREPKEVMRGRMDALGPVVEVSADERILLGQLEAEGAVLRVRLDGREAWCERRLLARIQRYTLDTLRREIEPVCAADFLHFLGAWQHVDEEHRLEGPEGVRRVVRQLAGFEAPTAAWEKRILAARVRGYRPEWLDQLVLAGEVAWGRLWGSGRAALRSAPVCFLPREELHGWLALAPPVGTEDGELTWPAQRIEDALATCGALFPADLERTTKLLPSDAERGLEELIALGRITSDSFTSLRQLLRPASRRRAPVHTAGRWSVFRRASAVDEAGEEELSLVAATLLRRYGVVFRALLERERQPIPWRDLVRHYRHQELKGDLRGGRFVAGFSGEQFALPEAIPFLRRIRRRDDHPPLSVAAADPLNLAGILTPDPRVPISSLKTVDVV